MTGAPAAEPLAASILFLRWDGLEEPAFDAALVQRLQSALRGWDAQRRLVLQAPRGLVVAGPVLPSVARTAARRILATPDLPPLRAGLHVGELRITPDRAVQARVGGEALHAAAGVADGAGEDRLGQSDGFRAALAQQGRDTRRQLLAGVGVVALLAAGFAGREALERYELARRPAVIVLDVKPWGNVYVDGELKGRAPPLVSVAVPPGPHVIEVRNGRLRPVRMEMQLQPGEELHVRHVFVAPAPPPAPRPRKEPGLVERFKFW